MVVAYNIKILCAYRYWGRNEPFAGIIEQSEVINKQLTISKAPIAYCLLPIAFCPLPLSIALWLSASLTGYLYGNATPPLPRHRSSAGCRLSPRMYFCISCRFTRQEW